MKNKKTYIYHCQSWRNLQRKKSNKVVFGMLCVYTFFMGVGYFLHSYNQLLGDIADQGSHNSSLVTELVSTANAETLEIRDPSALEIIEIVANKNNFKDVQLLTDIVTCESSLNYRAYNTNKDGSGDLGLFQFNTIHNFGEKPLDPYWATQQAINWIRAGRISAWYSSRSCWQK